MKLDEIWILHHSHTDIGYTLEQPVLWEMQRRFIDTALDACEMHADHNEPHAFKWVVETVAPLLYWLDHSSDRQIARFQALEKAGRIEVGGAFLNATPLADTGDYIEMLQPVARLRRDYGFTISHMQNADVNGHNWPLVDVMRATGLETFSMAINIHYGGAPFERPGLFHWQGPSGASIPALNNWAYPTAGWCGIPGDVRKLDESIPMLQGALDKVEWPLPFVLLQGVAYGDDNGTADIEFSNFIRDWNERGGERPRLRMVTWREFWQAARPALATAPVHAGDWTDYWNFGAISSARETAVARRARSRLRTADMLHASLQALEIGTPADRSGSDYPGRDPQTLLATTPAYRQNAWRNLETWHEHTWGSYAATQTHTEHAAATWHHKAKLAWQAHSLSLLLARDGAAELAIRTERNDDDKVVLYNPLPWERTVWGDVVPQVCNMNLGLCGYRKDLDPSAGRHEQNRGVRPNHRLSAVTVPGCGYTMVPESLFHMSPKPEAREGETGQETYEDNLRRIVFNCERGGISSWFDKQLGRELVDGDRPWGFGAVVHEEVLRSVEGDPREQQYGAIEWGVLIESNWQPDWPATRRSHSKLLSHMRYCWPDAIEFEQLVEVPGLASPATLNFIIPRHENTLEVRGRWDMGVDTWPESTYLALPFDVPDATVRYDVGGIAIEPGRDQLAGTCRDYFHLQNWADFSCDEFGVTVATPENPLAQFGDFHFAHDQKEFALERSLFLGWITSNYWMTNFPGHQPGQVTARYCIRPHHGYDENAAHRFGLEATMPCTVQNAREASRPETPLPRSGSLLKLPEPPILVQQVQPAEWTGVGETGILLRLVNASDDTQTARIGSDILQIAVTAICDPFGKTQRAVTVHDGTVFLEISARQQATLRIETA